jgi:ABC-type phosphate/phosphonate transport system substrate-binding protein
MRSVRCSPFVLKSSFVLTLLFPALTLADEVKPAPGSPGSVKTSYAPTGVAPSPTAAIPGAPIDTIVLAAPPRESESVGHEIFDPIAAYLSKAIGKKVVYKHTGNWGVYRSEMLKGSYDIVFDGPHFNGYRAEKLKHTVVAKGPGEHVFVTIVKKENVNITHVRQLAGRTVCAHAPPNMGTLMLQDHFDNPIRQPIIISTDGWKSIYDGVLKGKCQAGVLPQAQMNKFDPSSGSAKVITRERPIPNNAFSVGPRLSLEEVRALATALTADEAVAPTDKLRKAYALGERLISTSNQEFIGLAQYLKGEWGYY